MNFLIIGEIFVLFFSLILFPGDFEKDVFETSEGELTITFIGHGTLMMEFSGKIIHIDPVPRYADYSQMPKGDLILVTHSHGDHFDTETIDLLKKSSTELVLSGLCYEQYGEGKVMKNGDSGTYADIKIDAVPAYNIKHMRSGDTPYHPKGEGNGYVLHLGDKKVYVAGDTENIPEMANLKNIDIAFLPMNVPYTMTPEMAADAAKMFKPKILYPYHYGNTDTGQLLKLMQNQTDTEVRIRELQ
jgi:L-ascorbate metabolism protein UlaG (beta-lactamase superfamily)